MEETQRVDEPWVPADVLLRPLLEMGISENAATKGLFYTGNMSVDAAASWVFDNNNDPAINSPIQGLVQERRSPVGAASEGDATHKMVFVVNTELKMGIGKIAAQVAHACHALYKYLVAISPPTNALQDWEETGTTKIVLKANNAAELMELEEAANHCRIPNYLVIDAGRTQIAPSSITVLGLFGRSSEVDKVTGVLQLL